MVVTVVTGCLVPILVIVHNERLAIQQERKALSLLDTLITTWVYDDKAIIDPLIDDLETTFKISYTIMEESKALKACIAWKSANDRNYERCESGKK